MYSSNMGNALINMFEKKQTMLALEKAFKQKVEVRAMSPLEDEPEEKEQ